MFKKFITGFLLVVSAACAPTYHPDVISPERRPWDRDPQLTIMNYDRSQLAIDIKVNHREFRLANGESTKLRLSAPIFSACHTQVTISSRGARRGYTHCDTPMYTYVVEAKVYTIDNRMFCRDYHEFRVYGDGRDDNREFVWEIRGLPCSQPPRQYRQGGNEEEEL